MAQFLAWDVTPPTRWQAGKVGVPGVPFYFDCAECEAKEPPIAGFFSTDGTFQGIGIIPSKVKPFGNPALYCAQCWQKKIDAAKGAR